MATYLLSLWLSLKPSLSPYLHYKPANTRISTTHPHIPHTSIYPTPPHIPHLPHTLTPTTHSHTYPTPPHTHTMCRLLSALRGFRAVKLHNMLSVRSSSDKLSSASSPSRCSKQLLRRLKTFRWYLVGRGRRNIRGRGKWVS